MRRLLVAVALVLLLPFAAAARDDWFGTGRGTAEIVNCDTVFTAELQRTPTNASRWDITLRMQADGEFRSVATFPPQFEDECVLPWTRTFESVPGTDFGRWKLFHETPCITKSIEFGAISTTDDASLVDFEYKWYHRCISDFDHGRGQLVLATAQPRTVERAIEIAMEVIE